MKYVHDLALLNGDCVHCTKYIYKFSRIDACCCDSFIMLSKRTNT